MRRVGVLGVSLAGSPHFVQQERARCVNRAVQIIAQAAFLSAGRTDQRTQFRFQQRFLPLACT